MEYKKKKFNTNRVAAYALSSVMLASIIPYNVFANMTGTEKAAIEAANELNISSPKIDEAVRQAANTQDTDFTEAKAKENWDKEVQDKSRWPVGKNQRLVRVSPEEPIRMSDIDYDGVFLDADGNTVIRLVYKERSTTGTLVWYRALFNFGELDQYIDYEKSYVIGTTRLSNKDGHYPLTPFNDRKERMFDLGLASFSKTGARTNLPINLVLKDKKTIKDLGDKNYTVQMRLTDRDGKRIYAYAPGKSSMDYSTYTKTTSVAIEDNINNTFLKGGKQTDGNNATSQETFFSEFIANPKEYKDESQLGIIRTQYFGVRSGTDDSPTVGGQPIGFTQVFDKNLVNFLKEDDEGNVAYVNLLTNAREVSPYAHRFGIKRSDINYTKDGKSAYIVIAPNAYQKAGLNKVEVEKHDQYTMLQGYYISTIDYVVDKKELAKTFDEKKTRKLDYSMMSGWTNPNNEGWIVYEQKFNHGYVADKDEAFIISTSTAPAGGQIMIKIGDSDQGLIRRGQGYYYGVVGGNDNAVDKIEKISDEVFKITLREGAKIKAGDSLKVYLPYSPNHDVPVSFMEISNATELNGGSATLKQQSDGYINMHIYTDLQRGASFKLKYTLKNGTESSLVFNRGLGWTYNDKDKVLTGSQNTTAGPTGGNFYIDPGKLKPGVDIFVEAYDEKGNLLDGKTSAVTYSKLVKIEQYKDLTWTDSSDKLSILSINKSLYKPYQVVFTNDYVDGTDDFYKNPHVMPADNANFMTDTSMIQGYTKYDGGLVRMRTELIDGVALLGKAQAQADEYDDKGNLTTDNSVKISLTNNGTTEEYRAYMYDIDINALGTIGSAGIAPRETPEEANNHKLELLKDKKLYFNVSDGSSLPTELVETRVRTRVLFDTTEGQFADKSKKSVKIVPDNVKYLDDEGYVASGFEGANVQTGTGDAFPEAPTATGKTFLGWVTEEGKAALGKTTTTSKAFNELAAEKKFTAETPVTTHQVVYAIYTDEKLVTFDANGGKFADDSTTKTDDISDGVQAPANPTQEGKEFVGWATSADATEADVTDLSSLTEGTTVYAVWKDAKTDAEKNPAVAPTEKTEVEDKTALTDAEKTEVEGKVKTANPEAKTVTVGDDGSVTLTYQDGTTNTLTPEQTITERAKTDAEKNPAVAPTEKTEVEDKTALTDAEKTEVEGKVKTANPEAKTVTVGDDGSVTLTYQDGTTNTLTPEQTISEREKTTVDKQPLQEEVNKEDSTKDTDKYKNADQDKKDAYDKALEDAKKVLEDPNATQEEVNKAKEDLTKAEEALNGEATPAVDKKPLQDEVDKEKATKDTDKYKNADQDKKDAYDKALEDAKKVLEDPNATQEEVNKAKKALEEAEKALNGKTTSDNDNTGGNDGYRPGHGGSDVFDRLFRRHDYTPTHPVKTVVPEKTQTAVPVRDTLWYVFRINDFEYEVVRNGVVTKRLMDVTPVLQNNRTMLPLRYVAEALQADVKWDAKTRTATFTKDGLTATIQIDSDEIVLSNGKTIKMDSKPLNINDRILVSVTNVANVFGLTNGNTLDKIDQDIEWEQQDKSATIYIRR